MTADPALPPQMPGEDGPAFEQQAPPPAPPAAASTPRPVNVEALQNGLTLMGQQNAAMKKALGLPKTASGDDFLSAIEDLRQRATLQSSYGEGFELSPEQAAREKLLAERSWAAASRDFGDEFTLQARHIRELVYNTSDGYELTEALRELASQLVPAADTAPSTEQAPASNERPGVDMELGQPGWIATPDADDKPGSGDTEGFFRRMFAQAR